MKNEEILRAILKEVCDGYVECIVDNLKENYDLYSKDFKITLACSNMLAELKSKNILLDYHDVFVDIIIDRIYREISNYLAR